MNLNNLSTSPNIDISLIPESVHHLIRYGSCTPEECLLFWVNDEPLVIDCNVLNLAAKEKMSFIFEAPCVDLLHLLEENSYNTYGKWEHISGSFDGRAYEYISWIPIPFNVLPVELKTYLLLVGISGV